jgi:4-amino-4-deoxy-L-arabinose transferase-like glycosyltransferase
MDLGEGPAPRGRRGLLVLLFAFCLIGVFDHSLWAPNDSREGGMVSDMFRSGEWTTLTLNGEPFLEKPPLLHWTALVLCKSLGRISAGLVRFPAALYGALGLGIVLMWGRRLSGERAALLAACLCATTLSYAEYSRIVLTDICLTFMVMLALHAFWCAYSAERGKRLRYGAFLLAGALSFYAKGVLGPGLVMTSVVAFLVLRREWRLAFLLPLAFAPILVAVVLPWAVAVHRQGGAEALIGVFVDNQLGRFFQVPRGATMSALPIVGPLLGSFANRPIPVDPYFVHKEPIYYYLVHLPVYWLPWAFLVPPALWHWFRRGSVVVSPLASLVRCAFVTIVVVLHLSSSKVACYALPLFPLLFVMVGVWCDDALTGHVRPVALWSSRLTFALVQPLLVVVPLACLLLFTIPFAAWRQLDAWLHAAGVKTDSMGDPSTWVAALDPSVVARGVLFCAAALALGLFALRRLRSPTGVRRDCADALLGSMAALMAVVMLSLSAAMPIVDHQRSYEPIAGLLRTELGRGRRLALSLPDNKDVGEFTFYADTRLTEVSLIPGVRDFLQDGGGPRGVLVRVEDLDAVVASLDGMPCAMQGVPEDAGYKSKAFRLITAR